jgi:hypothetical protein
VLKKLHVARGGKISFSERGWGINIVFDQNIDPCPCTKKYSVMQHLFIDSRTCCLKGWWHQFRIGEK